MTLLLEGRGPSARIKSWVADSIEELKSSRGFTPSLVTVQIGEDPASETYIRSQLRMFAKVGAEARLERFPADVDKEVFLRSLVAIGRDEDVDGIILQRPFPEGWKADEILSALPADKDAEGVHPENLGKLYLGDKDIPRPCTAWAALTLLEWYGLSSFEGKRCTVVGRSPNVGRAIAIMAMHRHATVTVCHTRTSERHMREAISGADVLIAAAGSAGIVKAENISSRAWVVDVGTNVDSDGNLVGDVSPGANGAVEALSPVPGGVGPMTVALLAGNLLLCAKRRRLGGGWDLPSLAELRERQL
jgi:methylenetetrahydrofolate dehydrogenase (NADP+)/methenyltetrahydrofolate cyclohydrolase